MFESEINKNEILLSNIYKHLVQADFKGTQSDLIIELEKNKQLLFNYANSQSPKTVFSESFEKNLECDKFEYRCKTLQEGSDVCLETIKKSLIQNPDSIECKQLYKNFLNLKNYGLINEIYCANGQLESFQKFSFSKEYSEEWANFLAEELPKNQNLHENERKNFRFLPVIQISELENNIEKEGKSED